MEIDSYDFEKIPLWNGASSSFEILSDEMSGRIPVTRIEKWQDFSELLESDFFNQSKTQLVFRGHRRCDWELLPTLARVPESGIIDKALADRQLEHFRRAVRGRLSDNDLVEEGQEDELWSVGQHHGLMTPLLDWTYSPYVALFFAFSKEDSEEEKENPYRAVYVLNKTFVSDDELCPDIRMFEPKKDDHGRLVNQAGLFTFSPYGSTIENKLIDTLTDEDFPDDELRSATLSLDNEGEIQEDQQAGILAKYICKIYIKNDEREKCMLHLRRMNVHHSSLFPDLIGACEFSNLIVAEEHREYEIEQSEKRLSVIDKGVKDTSVIDEQMTVPFVNQEDVSFISEILNSYGNDQVEPGRVLLIAEHITKDLPKYKVVDWTERDSAISKMRTMVRITLRKYGFPALDRDAAVEGIVNVLINMEKAVV